MSSRDLAAYTLDWPRWKHVLLALLLVVLAMVRLSGNVEDAAYRFGLLGDYTTAGGTIALDPEAPRYFYRVVSVDPGGPMDKAGIKPGDYLKTAPKFVTFIRLEAGQRFEFVRDRGGVQMSGHFTIAAIPPNETERSKNYWEGLRSIAAGVTALIGSLILWRGWGNKTAMALGASMFPMFVEGVAMPAWTGNSAALNLYFPFYLFVFNLTNLMLLFAMWFYEESVGPFRPWQRRAIVMLVCWFFIQGFAVRLGLVWGGVTLPILRQGGPLTQFNVVFTVVIVLVVLTAAWLKSEGIVRNRNAVVLLAIVAYAIGWIFAISNADPSFGTPGRYGFNTFSAVNLVLAGVVAPVLLAYSMLRHKLFDLGFAVNRSLVFGTISIILLVGFALIEWAVDHLVPEEWHKASAFYSAGIAVGLFLVFHRLRDAVEHFIERLFFKKWQVNELALKRFVRAAAHIERPEALTSSFIAELARFTGGAVASIHTRAADGQYFGTQGGVTIEGDDLALAAMRAERDAVVPAEVGSTVAAALAFPMMHQAALAGFVLLGPKPTHDDYRPDEIEILTWATQQVGLDLQAIRVRDLELTNIRLIERNQTLADILGTRSAQA